MATTTVAHASLIRYDSDGNQLVINLKNTGDDVSINRSSNGNLPSGATTAQGLANSLGALAFKSSLSKGDVGLGNVDNTADSAKSVKYATSAGSANAVAWGNVSGKPSTYPPSAHTQAISTITNLQTELDGKFSHSTISSEKDLDTITTTGIYHIAISLSSDYHAPTSNHHTLIVDFNVGTPYQIFIPDALNVMYKRTYTRRVFSKWMEMKFTDTQVTQIAINSSDYTNWRTIIWGSSNSATEGFTPASVTDSVFSDPNLTYQPSSGTLRANTFKGNLTGNASSASSVLWSGVTGKPSTYPSEDNLVISKTAPGKTCLWAKID